ncbi:MAG TPA: FAD:protein FMN transferase [Methylibium sp.]
MSTPGPSGWQRRARPLLGTLVEVGAPADAPPQAIAAAFAAVERVQALMSRFDPASDVARFNALARGEAIAIKASTAEVMHAARELELASGGLFDVSAGCPQAWRLQGLELAKQSSEVKLDLGGIAKGYAVDLAVQAMQAAGCEGGWVNAGGDARAFGPAMLPILLRDEMAGGVRPFVSLSEGAIATSHYGPGSRSQVWRGGPSLHAHVSVAAPQALWADALTKIVALSGDTAHPLLNRHQARAWLH